MFNPFRSRRPAASGQPREDTRRRLASSVLAGRDGYLFHRDGHALQQVTGQRPLAPDMLNRWVSSVETRKSWCEARGSAFRLLVVPEKHVVYADKLPPGIELSEDRPVRQILGGLDAATRSAVVYPLEELVAARAVRDTYFLTDTHWTTFGGLVGFRALAASLAAERPLYEIPESYVSWTPRETVGDLGVRLEPEHGETVDVIGINTLAVPRVAFQNKLFTRGSMQVFETNRPELPRGVLFRDSFGLNMLHVLLESFSRLVVVGSQSVQYDLLRIERPDIVISETCERFLGMPDPTQAIEAPQDLDGPDFPSFAGVAFAAFAAPGSPGADGAQTPPADPAA